MNTPRSPGQQRRDGASMSQLIPVFCLMLACALPLPPPAAAAVDPADFVLVRKSAARLYLMRDGEILKSYGIALGRNPIGAKVEEGDMRTPEGRYYLDYKKTDSAFYRAIHISYPNDWDRLRAAARGVSPGGMIMIHGQKNGLAWRTRITQRLNWTNGCIAVSNDAMDEIWDAVAEGTPIQIVP